MSSQLYVILRRRFSTVVDLSHLSTPIITSPSDLPSSLSSFTVYPPVPNFPRVPTPKRIAHLISTTPDPLLCLRIFDHASRFCPNYSHNYSSYIAIINRLLSSRHFQPIPSLLSSLKSSNFKCGEQLFINLINAYSLAFKPNLSLKIFLQIPTFGVQTSVRAFNALLNAMIMNKRYDLVDVLFKNCVKKFRIEPNVFTCNILLKALCEMGKIESALKVVDEMPEMGMIPNVVTYTTIMSFYCSIHDLVNAKKVFNEIVGKDMNPDVRTYTILIDGFCKVGKLEDAIKVMDEMEENEIMPNEATYSIMIRFLCENKKAGEALSLIMDMLDGKHVPCSSLCCKVIDALCESGKVSDACDVWKKLLRKNVTPDNSITSTLIYWLCKVGKVWDARKLFDEFGKGFVPSVLTYNTLILGLCENGELQEAGKMWDDMVERKCYPNVFTYNVLIKGFCKVGKVKEGIHVLDEMLEFKCEPDKVTYEVLVDALFQSGEKEEAFEVVGDIALRRGEFLNEYIWDMYLRKLISDTKKCQEILSSVLKS